MKIYFLFNQLKLIIENHTWICLTYAVVFACFIALMYVHTYIHIPIWHFSQEPVSWCRLKWFPYICALFLVYKIIKLKTVNYFKIFRNKHFVYIRVVNIKYAVIKRTCIHTKLLILKIEFSWYHFFVMKHKVLTF